MPRLKRSECADCEFWKTVMGHFVNCEMPERTTETFVDPKTGHTTIVAKPPTLDIHDYGSHTETRSWCVFPFARCRHDVKGDPYVVCDLCPCAYDSHCAINGTEIGWLKGINIVLAQNCPLIEVNTKRPEDYFIPEERYFE